MQQSNKTQKWYAIKEYLNHILERQRELTHSTSFIDFEIVPIFLLVFQTLGYLGRGPLAAHTWGILNCIKQKTEKYKVLTMTKTRINSSTIITFFTCKFQFDHCLCTYSSQIIIKFPKAMQMMLTDMCLCIIWIKTYEAPVLSNAIDRYILIFFMIMRGNIMSQVDHTVDHYHTKVVAY